MDLFLGSSALNYESRNLTGCINELQLNEREEKDSDGMGRVSTKKETWREEKNI